MNEVLKAINRRRSVRVYLDRPVSEEKVKAIIEAGRCAPSGGNHRSATFIVIQNPEIINRLNEIACSEFAKMEIREDMYPNMIRAIKSSRSGTMKLAYNAPVLILFCNKKKYINALADCVCSLENMAIAAEALELGSCYVNQIHWLTEYEKMRAYLCELGMSEEDNVYCSLILGYPENKPEPITERKGNEVIFHQ